MSHIFIKRMSHKSTGSWAMRDEHVVNDMAAWIRNFGLCVCVAFWQTWHSSHCYIQNHTCLSFESSNLAKTQAYTWREAAIARNHNITILIRIWLACVRARLPYIFTRDNRQYENVNWQTYTQEDTLELATKHWQRWLFLNKQTRREDSSDREPQFWCQNHVRLSVHMIWLPHWRMQWLHCAYVRGMCGHANASVKIALDTHEHHSYS